MVAVTVDAYFHEPYLLLRAELRSRPAAWA